MFHSILNTQFCRPPQFFTAQTQCDIEGVVGRESNHRPCGNRVVPLHTQPKQPEDLCPLSPCIFLVPDLVIQPEDHIGERL